MCVSALAYVAHSVTDIDFSGKNTVEVEKRSYHRRWKGNKKEIDWFIPSIPPIIIIIRNMIAVPRRSLLERIEQEEREFSNVCNDDGSNSDVAS